MSFENRPSLGIWYEHPDWFRPLFAALEARGVPYDRTDARGHWHDPAAGEWPHRVSIDDYSVSNRGLRSRLCGTPEQVAERVLEFENAGVDLLLLQFSPQYEEMERFAEQVIPLVREREGARAGV
jgi:alkanesulfonate monooxygenase SsuD/methylene tetrahydromethanopterin reductase-like flavin-dependent oxidoreductase (luciferase family)